MISIISLYTSSGFSLLIIFNRSSFLNHVICFLPSLFVFILIFSSISSDKFNPIACKTVFDGYEIEFGKDFSLGSGELSLSFGRDVVNAKFSDGHYVPRINPARNIYSLSYKQEDLVFKLVLKDVEKQNDFGEGETATDSYQMLNTRLTKSFSMGNSDLKVTLFANNLLDEVARNHASFVKEEVPLPGRNYGLKFNFDF